MPTPTNVVIPLPKSESKWTRILIDMAAFRSFGSSCFCSPTGDCAFGVSRTKNGRYLRVLQTHMVREFGFLKTSSNGMPDLELWSHNSAQIFREHYESSMAANRSQKCG